MGLGDISVETWGAPDRFALQVDCDPCYSDGPCCGMCGTASTYLDRAEMEALRDKISAALDLQPSRG